jgi:hypothetical protein
MPDFDASTWLDIPHPDLDGQSIIGILERRAAVAVRGNSNGRAKPIALVRAMIRRRMLPLRAEAI